MSNSQKPGQNVQATATNQVTPSQAPLQATSIAVIPAAISPPVPVGNPAAAALTAINETLAAAGTVHQQQLITIQSALQTRLALLGTGASQCQAAVNQAIQDVLQSANACAVGDQQCIENYVASLTSQAWEYASQAGCTQMPQLEVTKSDANPTQGATAQVTQGSVTGPTPDQLAAAGASPSEVGQYAFQIKNLQYLMDEYFNCLLQGDVSSCSSMASSIMPICQQLDQMVKQWGNFSVTCVLPQVTPQQPPQQPQPKPIPPQPPIIPPPQPKPPVPPQPPIQPPPQPPQQPQPQPKPPAPPQPPQQPPQVPGVCGVVGPPLSYVGYWSSGTGPNGGLPMGGPVAPINPQCGPIVISTYFNADGSNLAVALLNTDGTIWLVPTLGGAPNINASWVHYPSGADVSACFPLCKQQPPAPPQQPPQPPVQPPPIPQPPASCPPPPTCPTPKPCPTCNTDPCKCKDKKPWDKQFCIWRDGDGNCYQTSPGQGPNNANDTLIGCDSDPGKLAPIMAQCKKQTQPPVGPLAGSPNAPYGGYMCSMNADTAMQAFQYAPNLADYSTAGQINNLLANTLTASAFAQEARDGAPLLLKWWVWFSCYVMGMVLNTAGNVIIVSVGQSGCASVTSAALKGWMTILGFLGRWVSPVFNKLAITSDYADSWLCPQQIPTTSEANACYLSNSITPSLWNTWVRANNDCPDPQQAVIQAARSKENVGDLVQLYRRGQIDWDTYVARVRQLGYINDYEPTDYYSLSNQIPPVSELIRMMVRDVENEGIVTTFNLDQNFTPSWKGQLQKWGQQQGISDQYAQYEWRAHWDIPSNSQLYEMFHRFRKLPPGDPLYTDQATIKLAMQQNDVLPYWQDRLVASAFRLIPRSDLIQMTRYGVLTNQQLEQYISQLGYTDDDTKVFIDYLNRRHGFTARTHRYTRLYIQGEISQQQLVDRLKLDYYTDKEIADTVAFAAGIFYGRENAQCRDGIKKRFFLGEIDAIVTQGLLTDIGYDPTQVQKYISTWTCVRAAKLKHPTAALLCKWTKQGLLTIDQLTQRLLNIGYDTTTVGNVVGSCTYEIQKAQQAAAAKEKAKEVAALQKAAKQAAALAAKLARQAQQQLKQEESLEKAAIAVQKQIVKAAEKWARGCGDDIGTIITNIAIALNWSGNYTNLTVQEQLDAVIEAATLMDGKASCDWTTVYQAVVTAWSEAKDLAPGPFDAATVQSVPVNQGPLPSVTGAPGALK